MGIWSLDVVQKTFISEMSDAKGIEDRIMGGSPGVVFSDSMLFGEDAAMLITADYYVKVPIVTFNKGYVPVHQEIKTYAWLGENYMGASDENGEIVYITPQGTVYHEDKDCTYLSPELKEKDVLTISEERNARGEKYRACEACCG